MNSASIYTALAFVSFSSLQSLTASPWQIEASPQSWSITGKIEESESVSGAAIFDTQHGLLVSDEVRVIQPFKLDPTTHTLSVSEAISILPGDGKELDLEAIVASSQNHCYYATGSHAVSRKTGKIQPDRMHVFQLPIDPKTSVIQKQAIRVASLVSIIRSDKLLSPSLGKPSDKDGMDIEGLTEKDGQLFFGLRSPNPNGHAFILEVNANDLFSDSIEPEHLTHQIPLESGLGIRDLVKIKDGFLFIAGPTGGDEPKSGYSLQHWTGPNGSVTPIGTIPTPDEAKAEGLLILQESSTRLELLVFFDGAENGAPMWLKLSRSAGN